MPAWMTSELRDEAPVPIPSAASSSQTSRPESASARATASPTTPAPITTHSTFSVMARTSAVPPRASTRMQPVLVLTVAAHADGADQRRMQHVGCKPLAAAHVTADPVEPRPGMAGAGQCGHLLRGETVRDQAPVDVLGEPVPFDPVQQLARPFRTQHV